MDFGAGKMKEQSGFRHKKVQKWLVMCKTEMVSMLVWLSPELDCCRQSNFIISSY